MRDTLRWFLRWFNSFVHYEETSGGTAISGAAAFSVERNPVAGGRARVGGSADQFVRWLIFSRSLFHRFRVGDIVYVPSSVSNSYIQQKVRSMYTWDGKDYYEVGLGWFPDRMILSPDEYRVRLRQENEGKLS